MKKNTFKTYLFAIIVVASSLLFGFLLLDYVLGVYSKSIARSSKMDSGLMGYHSQLGWTLNSNWEGNHKHYDFNVKYSTNNSGFRYQPDILTSKKEKIAILGDSFTFGYGVNDNETFTNKLNSVNSKYSVVNYGVPGYSTDQEYLLLKKLLSNNKANHYVVMFYLGNDILDNALSHPLQAEPAKPFFVVDDGKLKLKNSPVPKERKTALLRKQSLSSIVYGASISPVGVEGFVTKLFPGSEIVKWIYSNNRPDRQINVQSILDSNLKKQKILLSYLLKAISVEILQNQVDLSIVLLPGKSYVNNVNSYSYYFQEYVRKYVIDVAKKYDLTVIDLASELANQPDEIKNKLFYLNEGHLTVLGHQKVSELLRNSLLNKQ